MRDPILIEVDEKVNATLSLLAMNAGQTMEEFIAKLAVDRATNPEPDVAELMGFGADDRKTAAETADGVSKLTKQVGGLAQQVSAMAKQVDDVQSKVSTVAKTLATMPVVPASVPAVDAFGRKASDSPILSKNFVLHDSANAAATPAARQPIPSAAPAIQTVAADDPKARFKAWKRRVIL